MAVYPLEGAVGCDIADTVPEERVARVSGVSAKDVALCDFTNDTLAVGEDRAREVEM